eukprot:TRINITY_DN97853_c0_g1_i1.p1 TRINITY_DN97853_c0_g1~~TRINITY_DN97853_c0_g1_i1.p1  ORF type:complete len:530 (-),score=81.47 TRINITY_DN97853_c0_g1_i1:56-1507(-)
MGDRFPKGRERSRLAKELWTFLEDPDSSQVARYYALLMNLLLQVSVFMSVLQTVQPPPMNSVTFGYIQASFDSIFLLEVIVRLYVCPSFYAFVVSFYNITDFVAAAMPLSVRAYTAISGADLTSGLLKYLVFCVAPVMRELKMLRRVQQFHLFLILLDNIKEAVQLLMMLLVIMLLIFTGLIYACENGVNAKIDSMPGAMYFTVVTVTTVGYGDITPKTSAGTLVATILTLFSVLYTAMPIGIIGNAFTQIWQDRHRILLMVKTRDIICQSGFRPKDLPDIFKEYATGEDDSLTLDGFYLMVNDMKLGIEGGRIIEVFESIDKDGGGSIDEQEFIRAIFPDAFHEIYGTSLDEIEFSEDGFERKVSGESADRAIKVRVSRASIRAGNVEELIRRPGMRGSRANSKDGIRDSHVQRPEFLSGADEPAVAECHDESDGFGPVASLSPLPALPEFSESSERQSSEPTPDARFEESHRVEMRPWERE